MSYNNNFLFNQYFQNQNRGGAVTGYWKELGRSELGSALDIITVDSLTTHRYYQLLHYVIPTGEAGTLLRSNNESGTLYAQRTSSNGGADGTEASATNFGDLNNLNFDVPNFGQTFVSNVNGEEKLQISHSISQNTAGAGTAPLRKEIVGKYVPSPLTTDITQFNLINDQTGSFDIGSQLIVLGWVDTLTHGITDNFWKFGNRTELGVAGDNIQVNGFGSHEWLMVRVWIKETGVADCDMFVNNVTTGAEYAIRHSDNGGVDITQATRNGIPFGDVDVGFFLTMIIRNQSDKEKLGIGHLVHNPTAGAGTSPNRAEWVWKWDSTSAQITEFDFTNTQGGSYDVGSFVEVWFAD